MMDLLHLMKNRRSVRAYLPQPVEAEHLNHILAAARSAPTACNRQPLRLIVIQSAEGLQKAGKAAQLYGAPLAILVCADRDRAWKRPFDDMTAAHIDASIATDHMMLSAAELGLGSVWICFFKPDVIREEFALPENLEPVNLLAIGHPDPSAAPQGDPSRRPLEEMVSYETL